ncbi:MAG TPA: CmcI family methyltransferase [Candidatus Elarobacter sp.]|jgi:cephalosporin hydroxylase|nr:CmcI family methyltransferase [Candidatus Elarobacter sp.]
MSAAETAGTPETGGALLAQASAALGERRFADAQFVAVRARAAAAGERERDAAEAVIAAARAAAVPERNATTEAYHAWYYETLVWQRTTWCGVPVFKSVSDLWNYQEIIAALRPSVIVELGTYVGGSALFFAHVVRSAGLSARVLTVDVDHSRVASAARAEPMIEFLEASSVAPEALDRIAALRRERPGPAFFILDSDHAAAHVYAELVALRDRTKEGDVVIVEDSNVNGHPVLPEFGPGPYEALHRYLAEHPGDYANDAEREAKFGFSFARDGFLVRRAGASEGRREPTGG